MPREGWEGYAIQKVRMAFEKLIERPDLYGPPAKALPEAQSDIFAVHDGDLPEPHRADLKTVKTATGPTVEVVIALARLYAATFDED